MNLKELCSRIGLQEEVTEAVLKVNFAAPERLLRDICRIDTAERAYGELESLCRKENRGFDMLSAMLTAATEVLEAYGQKGIDDSIFFKTMECFPRYIGEHKVSFGCYGFDRGWWTYRQLSMVLFRIGSLEFEYLDDEGIIHLHIPTDADISLEACRSAVDDFMTFTRCYYPRRADYPIITSTWLISPALDKLLPENSRIIRFKNCFELISWDAECDDFMEWVYKRRDIPYELLPTDTGLQKRMKAYLLSGGKVGIADGRLRGF